MSQIDQLERFREALAHAAAKGGIPPRPTPISITIWQAMSLLQKAVRRGRLELALQAASTLLEIAPDRFWRRAGITLSRISVLQTCQR
ncbi:hypothetical protein [Pseudogemmobacter humi]|uniref:Uncharacterized protein n=1 Tax=Pseudogemmobacter humi TaxID=2483812 RepID=A0A3P5X0K5_9RHOB|nr:hypothetical protein [Pseudogemmobacter humi]VDC27461.1 hypothetical protein XINFAN_01885 [Pseudogemmobacter humi]